MRLTIMQTVRPDGLDVTVAGEVDIESAPELRVRLLDAVRTHELVVLDLARVTFMDSQGLSVLVRADAAAKARDASLRITQASRRVRQLLELTQLTDLLPIASAP